MSMSRDCRVSETARSVIGQSFRDERDGRLSPVPATSPDVPTQDLDGRATRVLPEGAPGAMVSGQIPSRTSDSDIRRHETAATVFLFRKTRRSYHSAVDHASLTARTQSRAFGQLVAVAITPVLFVLLVFLVLLIGLW